MVLEGMKECELAHRFGGIGTLAAGYRRAPRSEMKRAFMYIFMWVLGGS